MMNDDDNKISLEKQTIGINYYGSYVKTNMQRYLNYKDTGKASEDVKYYYQALSLLDSLEFPLDQEGTYFFADIVGYMKKIIDENKNTKEGLKKIKMLLLDAEKPYSNLHLYVSSELNDIGCRTFHTEIRNTLIDMKNKKNPLLNKFCPDSDAEDETCQTEIGKLGFILAATASTEKDILSKEKIAEKIRKYNK